jgi:transcriptional regulator GlxA family with amidase domain
MRRIVFVLYDGFELLDLSGPTSVFANSGQPYEIVCVSVKGGAVHCAAGVRVRTKKLVEPRSRDTVIVVGARAEPLIAALKTKALLRYLQKASRVAERVASVCAGSFLLAATGVLEGRNAATHWEGCAPFERFFPRVKLQREALYVSDGKFWTSAGVTTGIDMALAILKRDHGARVMGAVAKRLVVYSHRPGNQSQFSAVLNGQIAVEGGFPSLSDDDFSLSVEQLARKAGMSERNFYRKFTKGTGQTPAKFLESLRFEKAKRLLEAGEPIKAVAPQVGYASIASFRKKFIARYGLSPSAHRLMHGST